MQTQAFDATRLQWPTNWSAVFERTAPLMLEIGFGNGQFLVALAKQNPQANILGIEISLPSIKKAEKKIKNQHLTHTRVIHGDARLAIWGSMEGQPLDHVFINFPDPWHKAAHHHRKLINDNFLHLLATRMPAGACLDIATDDAGYQDHITDCLERTPYFQSRTGRTSVTEDNERLRTKYELKALAEGRTCKYFKWARNEHSAENLFPTPKDLEMPHVILTSPLTLTEINERYKPQQYTAEMPIRFIRHYSSPEEQSLLVETHIVEEPLPQRVGLFVQQRQTEGEGHEYVLGLHELGFPRPTYGVHRAIAHLARWLMGLDGRTVIKHHNLSGGLSLEHGPNSHE